MKNETKRSLHAGLRILFLGIGGCLILLSLWIAFRSFRFSRKLNEEVTSFAQGESDASVIGILTIPSLDLVAPVYDNTEEESLQKGVGLWEYSDFPCTEEPCQSVIVGHSGLVGKELFTHLDRLVPGDSFFFQSSEDAMMEYRVVEIRITLPEENGWFRNPSACSRIYLVTCTPIGINSHRLVVIGERIPD